MAGDIKMKFNKEVILAGLAAFIIGSFVSAYAYVERPQNIEQDQEAETVENGALSETDKLMESGERLVFDQWKAFQNVEVPEPDAVAEDGASVGYRTMVDGGYYSEADHLHDYTWKTSVSEEPAYIEEYGNVTIVTTYLIHSCDCGNVSKTNVYEKKIVGENIPEEGLYLVREGKTI